MQGILLVDKPSGWTSFDSVNYIRKIVAIAESKKPKQVKVGHTGTLDPFATGLLVILIGKDFTRRAEELTKLDKTYEITMMLGIKSSTGDPEGQLEADADCLAPPVNEIELALKQFTGDILQTPPAFSAIKIGGQRAYKLARAGKPVELSPRSVRIKKLKLISYDFPEIKLLAEVSSGTYIRSLVVDIGQALGKSAYTSQLRRTNIGDFDIKGSVPVKEVTSSVKLTQTA